MDLVREIIGSAADIARCKIEAEARLFKQNTMRLITVCCMMTIGMIIFLAGIGFLLAALFVIIAKVTGAGFAALWMGAGLIVLAIILLAIIKALNR